APWRSDWARSVSGGMVLPDKYDSSRFYSMIETIYAAAMRRLSIVLVACALSVPARAQVGYAALTSNGVESWGAAGSGAAVSITAGGTGYARTQVTHDDGGYVAQGL